jgi:hypothetical protein
MSGSGSSSSGSGSGSGRLEDLLASLRDVGVNVRAMFNRTRLSIAENAIAIRFKIQNALIDALWSILGLSRLAIPVLKFIALLWVIFFAAITLYYFMYQHYVPKLLFEEPVYFNFDHPSPTATLNLLMATDHSGEILSLSHYGKPVQKKFLRSGSIYDFTLKFSIAKSPRNQDIGKFMAYMNVSDKKDNLVAHSTRPVIVPYHSSISMAADQVLHLPYYLLGVPETETLEVHMLRHYREAHSEAGATQWVSVSVSSSAADIMRCSLTIYPELSYFT